jgi:hypothetical protein
LVISVDVRGTNSGMSVLLLWLGSLYFRIRYRFNVHDVSAVCSGPFKGSLLNSQGSWPGHKARLIGTYEQELFGVVSCIDRLKIKHVIDVGCAEGYYSCGIANTFPNIFVTAYDLSTLARCCTYFAARAAGNLAKIKVARYFDVSGWHPRTDIRELVILDCEGFESTILNSNTVQKFTHVGLLVECHEMYVQGITQDLVNLLDPTHVVEIIWSTNRDDSDIPVIEGGRTISVDDLNEYRPFPMPWIWAYPKSW